MASYTFKKKEETSITENDKSSTVNGSNSSHHKSMAPEEKLKGTNELIKQENTKLIEMMLMDRKRQYSLPNEIAFNSNQLQQKKTSNKRVLKRFHKKSAVIEKFLFSIIIS